jgi:hypothetical protein
LSGGEGKKQGKIPWTEAPPAKEKGSAREKIKQREKEQRRKGNGTPQGLMRKFKKLQGPFCRA